VPKGADDRRVLPDALLVRVDNTWVMTNSPDRPYRRLTLSVTDKKLAGVCGGLAEYFGVDPTLVRLIVVLLSLLGGTGVLLYGAAWLIMPKP
jgi:phage shock protein PspC (stress-responsive transcriptional regulator)